MTGTPNVLLLMSDQHRGDCIGRHGHPILHTPQLDSLIDCGVDFLHAYSANPLCGPARRSLLTGQKSSTHGVLDENGKQPLAAPTLQQILSSQGFQTHLVGKLHFWPRRNYYGFETADWADRIAPNDESDYTAFIRSRDKNRKWFYGQHDFNQNSRSVCAWALEEELHQTNWCAASAVRFLDSRRDKRPFFLMVSFVAPHPPLFPVKPLLEKYLAASTHPPVHGVWSEPLATPHADDSPLSWQGRLSSDSMHLFRSAYYASIEHIDSQIGAILKATPPNTLIIYLSDHGDMLGDHFLFRKRAPYEAATRIPLIMKFPAGKGPNHRQATVNDAVELMDVAPTILDFLGIPIPAGIDGASLLPVIGGKALERQYIHGENPLLPPLGSGMQFISDGRWKFVWYPDGGWEQLFHLTEDPYEATDLSTDPAHEERLCDMRPALVDFLRDRPEHFTDGVRLLPRHTRATPFGSHAEKPDPQQ